MLKKLQKEKINNIIYDQLSEQNHIRIYLYLS